MRKILLIIIILTGFINLKAQTNIDYFNPKEYTLAGLSVSGIQYLSEDALKLLSGLEVGSKITIPGDDITNAIDKLWNQGLFSDVKISITKVVNDSVYLDIYLQEQPKLNEVYFYGINKSQEKDLKDKLNLRKGSQVTDNLIRTSRIKIKEYFADKGYSNVSIDFRTVDDTLYQNTVNLFISIDKKNKVKIKNIVVRGNTAFSDRKVKRYLKDTKEQNFFRFWKASKYIESKFKDDEKNLIKKYNEQGYRDARIIEDSVYSVDDRHLNVYLKIFEGDKYYYRNIEWIGNTVYTSEQLNKVLDIHKGDPYDQEHLQKRLFVDQDAVGNMYYNKGYLFFNAMPQEVAVDNDSVDIRILINEGNQATIKNIYIKGNDRTNDYVIRRELKTLPGELFSRDDLIRSVRELANLGNFDPEQLNPTPKPNMTDGTVDILYNVKERPNDRFELSGGYGYFGVTGRVGISFNNFAMKNLFRPKYWDPLPMGDGEKFSISANIAGARYQFYNISYTNPWFGGKKPNSFTVSLYYNRLTNTYSIKVPPTAWLNMIGASVGLGRRLKFPDDYFILSNSISFDRYRMKDYRSYIPVGNGYYNVISLTTVLARNSVDNPLYTRRGSNISFTNKMTPPYSLFTHKTWQQGKDSTLYKWTELWKINFKADWYNELVKNLVLNTHVEYGLVGYYNRDIGFSPFEAYTMGGKPMGYNIYGKEILPLRGYKDNSISDNAHVYARYYMELRYPIILKEMATLYVYGFAEAGNAWYNLNEFKPFELYRSAGVGARMFIPMLGLVGVDFGYGLDEVPDNADANGFNVHFSFGQQF